MDKTFSISRALAENAHPHTHTFTDGAVAGLTIRYADLPENWVEIATEAVGDELETLGFDPALTVQILINGIEPTGDDYMAWRDALDALNVRQKATLAQIVRRAQAAVLASVVGEWNDPDATPDAETLEQMPPSFLRAVFTLAATVTLSVASRDFLGKPRRS